MLSVNDREVWLRGPLPDVPLLLQPVAQALMQAREELPKHLDGFPESRLWQKLPTRSGKPLASVGFHLQHLTGVLDRLFTYARNEALTPEQLAYLAAEGNPTDPVPSLAHLIQRFDDQVEKSLVQLRQTNEKTLTDMRGVGRAQLPSTVLGLLVHSAEHTMRHTGQLLVTAGIVGV